ncbi:peptidase M50B-like protein [Prauserella shujinwangii]|uniref:Peptidase M50B-like protein n=2 Tax=Prauserella shujinwangii TaxID=1453103 RepID=A0A2T0LK20_9PSEU|nr:peptidase M50B-like protein [Prauserella shujinwangii]
MGTRITDERHLNRLVTCHHEAGHAVIHRATGGRVAHVKILSDMEGVMRPADEFDPDKALGWLTMILAGGEAAARYIATQGYSLGQGRRLARHGCRDDLALFRRYAQHTGISEGRARREADTLVRRHWGRIHRVAHKLDQRGRLSHSL